MLAEDEAQMDGAEAVGNDAVIAEKEAVDLHADFRGQAEEAGESSVGGCKGWGACDPCHGAWGRSARIAVFWGSRAQGKEAKVRGEMHLGEGRERRRQDVGTLAVMAAVGYHDYVRKWL